MENPKTFIKNNLEPIIEFIRISEIEVNIEKLIISVYKQLEVEVKIAISNNKM